MNLIGSDVTLMRDRYDEALEMQGIPCKYRYPLMPDTNVQGETVVESYSDYIDTYIFFEGSPKLKTYKRLGWVVENDADLPFLIHCSFHLPNLQKDCLFYISGQYTGVADRIFKITQLSSDLQAPDHIVAQVIPVYDEENLVGKTDEESKEKYDNSHIWIKQEVDYRGHYYKPEEEHLDD